MSGADADLQQGIATITTAHKLAGKHLELYNQFCETRQTVWKECAEQDKAIRDMFYHLGKHQADTAVAEAEAILYTKETESEVLNAVMKNEKEPLYTKDELRDAIRDVLAGKAQMTEEEVRQLQDEESARVAAILAKENGKF